MEIRLSAETIFEVFNLPITNTILTTWVASVILIISAFFVGKNVKLLPSNIQNFFEAGVEFLYNIVEDLAGSKTKTFFPIVATFFLFIIVSNYLGLLPGFGTIGFFEHTDKKEVFVPLLRSANSDLNTTLSLALVSLGLTHYYSVSFLGIGNYLKKFFSFNPIYLFVGLLELIAEFTKLLSLSFRLFGNIFAGDALLISLSGLFAFILPIPFLGLELLVGFVQAAIFSILTLVFMVILTEKHSLGGEH